jgi:hypothetical protein
MWAESIQFARHIGSEIAKRNPPIFSAGTFLWVFLVSGSLRCPQTALKYGHDALKERRILE